MTSISATAPSDGMEATMPTSTEAEPAMFRAGVRRWLEENFPPSLAGQTSPKAGRATPEQEAWRIAMGARGWGTPTVPAAYGGGGLTQELAVILGKELMRIGAYNPIDGNGIGLLCPTLLKFGTEAQKLRHIPPMCRNEVRWCQGFSEPGAGSDLASLQTRAVDMGDHFIVNGQKIWTSDAQDADMCFCLVRTDVTKKQQGISFVLINMRQPGVEVRPLRLINDTTAFCETFFTDAVVSKDDLVGPLHGGWAVTKYLLQFERQGGSGLGHTAPIVIPGALQGPGVVELARSYVGVDAEGRLLDLDLRQRLTRHLMEEHALQLTGARATRENRTGPSPASSALKNLGSKVRQDKAELAIEIMGHQGLGWGGPEFSDNELAALKTMLRSKSATIAGGTTEVQLNIISKRVLGLPDSTVRP